MAATLVKNVSLGAPNDKKHDIKDEESKLSAKYDRKLHRWFA